MGNSDSENLEGIDLAKEQREERLKWVFYGGLAMLFVVGGFYLQMTTEQRVLHVFTLTFPVYGTLLYVEEFEHLKKLWLWTGILVTLPMHIAVVAILLRWDARHPEFAQSGYMYVRFLVPIFAAELVAFSLVIDHFKQKASPGDPPRNLKRLLIWKKNTKPGNGQVITLADDDGDDPERYARQQQVRWVFWVIGAVFLVFYLAKGVLIPKPWLYMIQAGLLTLVSYGQLLYVEQKDNLRTEWLWVAALVAVPFHVALLGSSSHSTGWRRALPAIPLYFCSSFGLWHGLRCE